MLTVNQLTLTHRKDLTVLVDSLSFTLNDGERLALIGEEGNGKSTLLHLIRNTLEKRSDLRVFYMPQDVGDLLDFSLSPVELLSPSRKKGRAKPSRYPSGQHEIHRRRDEPSQRGAFRRAESQADVPDDGRERRECPASG